MSEALTSEASPSQSFPEEVHANTESGTGRRSRIRPRKDASRSSDRRLFEAEFPSGDDPERIVDARGMRQVSDAGALQPIVDEVLERCAEQAQQYRDGNQKVLGFLVGQCMKASRSSGNPKRFNELLRAALEA